MSVPIQGELVSQEPTCWFCRMQSHPEKLAPSPLGVRCIDLDECKRLDEERWAKSRTMEIIAETRAERASRRVFIPAKRGAA